MGEDGVGKTSWILRYPKITIFLLAVLVAYFIFRNPFLAVKITAFNGESYIGAFIAGLFYSFGFTTPFATGFFLTISHSRPLFFALVGGLGALISDIFIFSVIRISFMDEFTRLEYTKFFRSIEKWLKYHVSGSFLRVILYSLGILVIASPLPDEIGVVLLAGFSSVRPKAFSVMSFVANTVGIYTLLIL